MTTLVEFTPTYIVVGEFDSRKRYLRSKTGADLPITQGETIFFDTPATVNSVARWRYSVASYTIESNAGVLSNVASYTLVAT